MDSDDDYPLTEDRRAHSEESMGSLGSSNSSEFAPKVSQQEQQEAAQRLESLNKKRNAVPESTRLFLEAPSRTLEAQKGYEELERCSYQYKYLGMSGQDAMSCMCQEELDTGGINVACGDEDCINRGTKIECVNGAEMSMCGDDCANQRFQRREYAQITVIQTDMKGYGVRVDEDLEPDSFVWEYVGEVIEEKAFKKRMIEYDQQNRKHFYFMMLQKGEFIDATQKGSLGRFCNHSCNPNCYVEKWVVNDKLKMGIFTKRRVLKGEELTFNYNVDRYGADAQTCYCGEPNCIGVIGGKTQTESVSLLPVNISRALGSSVDEEQAFLKSLQDRDEKPDDVNAAYLAQLELRPVGMEEVAAVMSALLQVEDSVIVGKLMERIELSTDGIINMMKANHGFNAAARLLRFSYDTEDKNAFQVHDSLVLRVIAILKKWKSSKDYLERSGIQPVIDELCNQTNSQEVRSTCDELKQFWSTFEEYRRIKKKDPNSQASNFHYNARRAVREGGDGSASPSVTGAGPTRPNIWKEEDLPNGWFATSDGEGGVYYFHESTKETSWEKPSLKAEIKEKKERFLKNFRDREEETKRQLETQRQQQKQRASSDLQRIIDEATRVEQEKLEAKRKEEAKEAKRKLKKDQEAKRRLQRAEQIRKYNAAESISKSASPMKSNSTPTATNSASSPYVGGGGSSSSHAGLGEDEFRKLWKRHFAQFVPNMIKKHQDEVGIDTIKGCARDIVDKLVDKEFKKDSSRKPPAELSSEKRKKLKLFVEPYMEKVVGKVQEKKRRAEEHRSSAKKQHI